MKKIKSIIFAIVISSAAIAQSEHNLVPNSSFEELEGKVKEAGQVDLAYPWESINMNPVDLYSGAAKSDDFSVPENKYGKEKAKRGNNYVGVSFYGYKGKQPRSYLGTALNKPLEAGRQYCVKFHVSLSDMSKYAVNNLGLYLSKENLSEASEKNLDFKPQIMSITNKVFDKQFLWTPICGTYTAQGGEKYIAIGNFFPDSETKIETIRLSREFSGRQEYNAYYFIDDVSVIPSDVLSKKDCACDDIAGGAMEVEFKKFETNNELKASAPKKTYIVNSDGTRAEESIKKEKAAESKAKESSAEPAFKKFSSTEPAAEEKEEKEVKKAPKEKVYSPADVVIYFDAKKFSPKPSESAKLQTLANYLKANTSVKVVIEGHEDPSEAEVKFLGKRRGFTIVKQLKVLGVSEAQLEYVSKETTDPASSSDKSKNQRVTFSLK